MKDIPFLIQNATLAPSGEYVESFGPMSGTITAGVITLEQDVPEGLRESYYYLPEGALHDGSAAGWYRIEWHDRREGVVRERY